MYTNQTPTETPQVYLKQLYRFYLHINTLGLQLLKMKAYLYINEIHVLVYFS